MNEPIKSFKTKVSLLRLARERTRLEKRNGGYWGCCPFHSEKTPSFEVKTKNGEEVFFCQGCKVGGDVITFVELSEGITKGQAIRRVQELAQGSNEIYRQKTAQVMQTFPAVVPFKAKKTLSMEQWRPLEQALENSKEAVEWLETQRGLTLPTAKKLHLGYNGRGGILLPRIQGDKVVAVKCRLMKEKKFFYLDKDETDARVLFNVETIDPLDDVFLTEGEFDAAIFEQCGYRAVSVPSAGAKLLPEMKKRLKEASRIYLAGDNDGGVGNSYMNTLARELGENTFIIKWPGAKDANEFFLKRCGGADDIFRNQVEALKIKAQQNPVEGFQSVLEKLRSIEGTDIRNDPTRLHFPWLAVDDMNFNPRGSIVIIYSTYSGTGKTVFTTQLATHEAKRGETVVVYSPELRDEQYLALLAAQWVGAERPKGLDRAARVEATDYARTADLLEWTYPAEMGGPNESRPIQYYVGHRLPESDTDKIIDFIEFTIKVTGATRFFIDTLHRIITPTGRESLVETEGRVIKRLESIANQYGTIFVLVGQSNKEAEGLKEKNRNERGVLRGSRELQDVSYGIYLLHRNRQKESGPTPNLLIPETELILTKDRGKGPGSFIVPMLYRRDCSSFVLRDTANRAFEEPRNQPEESLF